MTEGHRFEPIDADVDVRLDLVVATGDVQFLAARGADTDEDRVEAFREQRPQAGHGRVVADLDAHVEDDLRLVFEHFVRQTELGDVRTHQAARLGELLEHHDLVAEWQEVIGDGE